MKESINEPLIRPRSRLYSTRVLMLLDVSHSSTLKLLCRCYCFGLKTSSSYFSQERGFSIFGVLGIDCDFASQGYFWN